MYTALSTPWERVKQQPPQNCSWTTLISHHCGAKNEPINFAVPIVIIIIGVHGNLLFNHKSLLDSITFHIWGTALLLLPPVYQGNQPLASALLD